MASKLGMVNLAVACEQERLLKWLLSAIDGGYTDVMECCVNECGHRERQQCVDHLLAIYHEESDPTDERPKGAEQEASGFSVRLLAPCGHELSESECVGTPNWQNKWRCRVCGETYSRCHGLG